MTAFANCLDQSVENAFWTWQSYVPIHMAHLPFGAKGRAAREVLFDAFREWYQAMPEDVSLVVSERDRLLREAGVIEAEIVKQIASFRTAIFPNSVSTLFWTVYELFSRQNLLEEVRAEVIHRAVCVHEQTGFRLDVSALKTECPLLLSVFQETQRMRHVFANIRKVTADTILDGRYLLKKGNSVQVSGQTIHLHKSRWSEDADMFDPYRFMSNKDSSKKLPSASSFAAWGAAAHPCPARQFATTEIFIIVALLATRVDISPQVGYWKKDPKLRTGDLTAIYYPR